MDATEERLPPLSPVVSLEPPGRSPWLVVQRGRLRAGELGAEQIELLGRALEAAASLGQELVAAGGDPAWRAAEDADRAGLVDDLVLGLYELDEESRIAVAQIEAFATQPA